MMRRLLVGGILVLLLAAAGVAYLLFSLDAIVARAIEREGTRVLGVPVSVGSVEISLSEGSGTLRGLRVGNPKGFSGDDALSLDEVSLTLDGRTLGSPSIRIVQTRIANPVARVEFDAKGSSNLQRLAATLGDQPSNPDAAKTEPQRFSIDALNFGGGSVLLTRPGAEKSDRLDLPAFDAAGISGTGGEIGKKVAQILLRQVTAVTAGKEAQRWVEKQLGGSAGKAAGEAAGKVIRDLFD